MPDKTIFSQYRHMACCMISEQLDLLFDFVIFALAFYLVRDLLNKRVEGGQIGKATRALGLVALSLFGCAYFLYRYT